MDKAQVETTYTTQVQGTGESLAQFPHTPQDEIKVKNIALLKEKPPAQSATRVMMQTALIAAILVAGKESIALIFGVEVVTLTIIVCAFVFPPRVSITAAVVFCTLEWLIYGFGYWVVAYYLYWPPLALVASLLRLVKKTLPRNILAVVIAVTVTAFFGVLTSVVDAAFASFGEWRLFFVYFPIIYIRGVWFYAPYIVSNGVIVGVLFTPLTGVLVKNVK
ncbi:MAG: hypothetical protein FWE84_01530 [Firmicutes bacterium]|nr:hypothetical protein [Bacillota bacterium]